MYEHARACDSMLLKGGYAGRCGGDDDKLDKLSDITTGGRRVMLDHDSPWPSYKTLWSAVGHVSDADVF